MTNAQATDSAALYIIATPIGNLDDISFRALERLKQVDFIIAEDTRHSGFLLNHFSIKKPMTSLHNYNETEKSIQLINKIKSGQSAALISDAGTPLISDPGFPLVQLARSHGVPVIPIPGASAVVAALSASGIPCDSFIFAGFLPAKRQARIEKLEYFNKLQHTLVFYESKHRIFDFFEDASHVFDAKVPIVLAKELTKSHETFIQGSSEEILEWLKSDTHHQKGEFVIIVAPRCFSMAQDTIEKTLGILLEELPLKQASKLASKLTGHSKNEIYEIALALKGKKTK